MTVEFDAHAGVAGGAPAGASDSGQFRIVRPLGEGGYGQVFEAWDAKLCRSVALKQLRPGALRRDVLMREARLAASLKHAAFVKIFAVDGDGDTQSIVMELVAGGTLSQYCEERRPTREFMLGALDQIAEAMAEAHAAGLIHGDIKPSNLMLEPPQRIRILDFGLARQIDPMATQTEVFGEIQGTIAFMAPERLMGKGPSALADIYSLGVVLYGMLAGTLPFTGMSGLALAAAYIHSGSDSWPVPATADPALMRLVLRMTERDPAGRMPSMEALRAEIRILLAPAGGDTVALPPPMAAPIAAPPVATTTRPGWPAPGRKTVVGLAFAACTIGAAGAAWKWMPAGTVAALRAPAYSEAASLTAGLDALRVFDRQGSLDAAIGHFNGVLAHNPRSAAATAGLALVYAQRYAGDDRDPAWLVRADAAAQAALQLDGQLALPHVALAAVREHQSRDAEALAAVERALALDPLEQFALIGKSRLLIYMRRFDDAHVVLAAAAKIYPRERRFADLLGLLHLEQGDNAAAETAFRRSLQLEPDAVFAYANLNATLLRLNRTEEALQILQQGLRIRPDSHLYTNLGTTLFARGDYLGAVEAFERAASGVGGSPNHYLMWANLADALRWVPGREAAAREAYLRAVQLLAPLAEVSLNDPTRLSRLGLYYARVGDKAGSLAWTARALAGAPANAWVQFRAAMASELTGQRAAAIAHLLKARALGYPANLIESEPDFIALRRDPLYQTATTKGIK